MQRLFRALSAGAILVSATAPSATDAVARVCDTFSYDSYYPCDALCDADFPRRPDLIQQVKQDKFGRGKSLQFLVTSCQAQVRFGDGHDGYFYCQVTICGFLQTATPRTMRIPPPDLGRANTPPPRFKTPAPGLLEGDAGFSRNAPSATGTPIAPTTGGGTSTGGRGGSPNVR